MFYCTPAMVVPVVLPALPPLPPPHCPLCCHCHCHYHHTTRHVVCSLYRHHHPCHWHTAHHITLGSCMSCHTVVLPTSPLLPAVSPSGGCVLCRAVVLPASPLPAHCLLCCCWAVVHRAALWCCLPHRHYHHLRAACHVAVGQLHIVLRCGAACLAAAATTCALPVMLPLGSCVLCCTVVLPVLPPPVRCLSCCCRAVACCAVLWCCPPCHQ